MLLAGGRPRLCGRRATGRSTCLDGYVWRQATPRDHVCVTPEVRAQTARDNALAPSRRSATPAPSAPTCASRGIVWRDALPGDQVCVTPATWQQVHDDNLTAGARRNALRVKLGSTGPPPGATGCTPTASTSGSRASRCSGPGSPGPRCRGPSSPPRTTGPGGELRFTEPARVRHAPQRDHPRARPPVAALVLVAPDRDGLRGRAASPADVLGPMARGGRARAGVAWSHARRPPARLRTGRRT